MCDVFEDLCGIFGFIDMGLELFICLNFIVVEFGFLEDW